MNSFIDLKITGKNTLRFILSLKKQGYNLYEIKHYKEYSTIKVTYEDYKKIRNIKTIYKIEIKKLYGYQRLKFLLLKYKIFIISLFVGLIFMIFLSSLIMEIEVITDNNELREFMYSELESVGIKKYKFAKGFYKNEELSDQLVKKNKDKIEWMEIERIGNSYIVKVEERKIKDNDNNNKPRDIVAGKKAIIKSIVAENGEVVKKINDFVNSGDVIISGSIKNKDEIKDNITANGKVFGEVWYKVKIELPSIYREEKETGKNKTVLKYFFFDKEYPKSKYENKTTSDIFVLKNNLLPIKIGLFKDKKIEFIEDIYTEDYALIKGSNIARNKLKENLKENDEIIYEKCLKIDTKDSKIVLDIFFKVLEDITSYKDIVTDEKIIEE